MGQLVFLGADEQISAQNSASKVVIREFPGTSLPYAALQAIGIYITPDLASETGNYERPFIHSLEDELLAASAAGAAGVIFTFDVPRKQVRGYGDPHRGTIYRVPALFVGGAEGRRLKSLAARGASARVVVAKVGRATTTNVIATLPGRSSQKIVLGTNTDGQSWVQENGVAGLIAFARYYAGLPLRCRPRTLQIAFASAHDAVISDGMDRVAAPLDAEFGRGRIAFAFAVEHLGTREIVPNAAGNRLRFTGKGSRSCSPPETATCCAARQRTSPRGGTWTEPRSSKDSASRRRGRCRRSAPWAGLAPSSRCWSRPSR